jgi:acetyltransferase-like isoleucine patch superfamily enzyme
MADLYLRMGDAATAKLARRKRAALDELAEIDPSCHTGPHARIFNSRKERAAINVQANCAVLGTLCVMPRGGSINIGEKCFIGEGSNIWSAKSIVIGRYVLISHNVNVHDSASHSLHWEQRRLEIDEILPQLSVSFREFDIRARPIVIEDDAWLGFNVTVLGGVSIGRGAIVASGSLVTKDIPAFCLVAGSPAKVVRELSTEMTSGAIR